MAGLRIGGLGSGLDTQSVVAQLMRAERAPRTGLTAQQAAATKRQSILQDIATKLAALKTATDDLKAPATWMDTQSVWSADATKVAVRRTGGAAPGGYDVSVTQMAAAERRTYAFVTSATASQLQVLNGDGTARSTIALAAGATLNDAVAAINGDTKANLFAVNVNGQLTLSAKTTGVASAFSVTGAGTQVDRVAGLDAMFQIGATAYTRPTNVIGDVLPGLELTLKGKTTAPVGITGDPPGVDKDLVASKVKAFVDAYNNVAAAARAAVGEKRVPRKTTTTEAQTGTLFGDSELSNMLTRLRTAVRAKLPGLSGPSSLSDIGVSTGAPSGTINRDAVNGTLTLDSARLTAALTSDPAGVRALLSGTATAAGFAQTFGAVVATYAGPGGALESRVSSAGRALGRLQARLDTFDTRMASTQTRYERRFAALEQAMSRSQAVRGRLQAFLPPPA
jgi:flagellar hook-associated protein 2